MEVEASSPASRQAVTPIPEGIRQCQLDSLNPWGGIAKESRIDTSLRDIPDASDGPVKPSPAPAAFRVTRRASPGTSNTRWNQDGMRQEKRTASRAVGAGEVRVDITPDG